MGVRLPTILAKAIQDVYHTLNEEYDEEHIVDLVECIHRMEDLMDDLQGNAKLRLIADDGAGDVALWNKVRQPVTGHLDRISPFPLTETRKSRATSRARTL